VSVDELKRECGLEKVPVTRHGSDNSFLSAKVSFLFRFHLLPLPSNLFGFSSNSLQELLAIETGNTCRSQSLQL